MKLSLLLIIVFVLLWTLGIPAAAITQEPSDQKTTAMFDRERQGLRGLVRMCVEEETRPAFTGGDGTNHPEWKSSYTTEYDIAGRIVSTRWRNPDGSEYLTRYTYDASGHVLKTESGKEGEARGETLYSYDDQGRLLKIANKNSANPVTFRYDEHGRKTKVQTTKASDFRPYVASGGSPFAAADTPPNLPDGGVATTIYDEQDRPTEVQIRNLNGQLLSHAVRVYDKQGRVSEEKQILDNPDMLIPAEMRKKAEAAGVIDDMRAELARFLGGPQGMHSIAYTYDADGRVTHTQRDVFSHDRSEIETSYNEHGDQAGEITRHLRKKDGEAGPNEYSEVRYSYRYDTHGNWTERTLSYRHSPDEAFQSSTTTYRTLTYH